MYVRIRHCLPKSILFKLYYTLILPYLSYCNICWGSNYTTRLKHLFTLQKRAIRIVCNMHWMASTDSLFKPNKLLCLNDINKFQVCLFMYCFHFNILPITFKHYFTPGLIIHDHYTRQAHAYRSEAAHLKIKLFTIKCYGPHLWNKLPDYLTKLPTVGLFKSKLKNFLLDIGI